MLFALISAVSMLIVLGVLVLVHEFGHFAVAKFFGVRVETFSIGFGTRLFGFRRGDTDYRISLVPLGGYVKMAGELGGDGTIPVSGANASATDDPRSRRLEFQAALATRSDRLRRTIRQFCAGNFAHDRGLHRS